MSPEKKDILLSPESRQQEPKFAHSADIDGFHGRALDALDKKQLILKKLFPEALPNVEDIEAKYPPRDLPKEALVTRIAPSPTGFMHIGGIYTAMISEKLAQQSGGVFYLRIEDTDQKREVDGASALITSSLLSYGLQVDEGQTIVGQEAGSYGPYKQSERGLLYKSYVRELVEKGLAYPCFCTSEELDEMRRKQEVAEERPGYYGENAVWRNRSDDEVLDALDRGLPYVIRFKSPGNFDNRIVVNDLLKGRRELPENDHDLVVMKSDGLPTYHFAHVVDDHLMHTTHVVRGDEWFPSLPIHLQLFERMGWSPPAYGHLMPVQKMDGDSKRKLSKRKDPEANVRYYSEQGYPVEAVMEYLMNLANSNFEEWRKASPKADNRSFPFSLEKLAKSGGALFDFKKLDDISREVISRYSASEIYEKVLMWAKDYRPALAGLLERDPTYAKAVFNIDREGVSKVRKDIAKWSDVEGETSFYFDETFSLDGDHIVDMIQPLPMETAREFIRRVVLHFDSIFTNEKWFDSIKPIAEEMGFAGNAKALREAPERFKGSAGDLVKVLRIFLTGRTQTPDLFSIIKVLGKERTLQRFEAVGLL